MCPYFWGRHYNGSDGLAYVCQVAECTIDDGTAHASLTFVKNGKLSRRDSSLLLFECYEELATA